MSNPAFFSAFLVLALSIGNPQAIAAVAPLIQRSSAGEIDTLSPESFGSCLEEPVLWVTPGVGPVFGNNLLGDREKAQRLFLPSAGTGFVTHAIVRWGSKVVGENGSIRIKAWSVGENGAPESFLTATDIVRLSDVDTAAGFAVLAFPAPAAFSSSVFLSLDLSNLKPGDTINLPGTEDGCGSGCVVWERWSDGSWNPVCDTYDFEDIDMLVQAVVDWSAWAVGLESPPGSPIVGQPFPQPASNTAVVPLQMAQPEALTWTLFDSGGRVVRASAGPEWHAGTSSLTLPLAALPEGLYWVQIRGKGAMASRAISVGFDR
ncbi:MAG: hypothetical protein GC205_12220 [Bacteroidetes bacterium]|nr:hypothetical protein [Bacteroidota bacterium]